MAQKTASVEAEPVAAGCDIVRPASDVVMRRLGHVAVLIRLTTNRIYELNVTGVRVWELLQEGLSRQALLERLSDEFGTPNRTLGRDVDDLLRKLHAEGLTVSG